MRARAAFKLVAVQSAVLAAILAPGTAHADSPVEASIVHANRPVVRWSCPLADEAPLCSSSSFVRIGKVGGATVGVLRTSATSAQPRPALEPGRWWWQVTNPACDACVPRRHEFSIRGKAWSIGLSSTLSSRTTLAFRSPFRANGRRAAATLRLSQGGTVFHTSRFISTVQTLPNRRTATWSWTNDDVPRGSEVTARVTVVVGGRAYSRTSTLLAPGEA